MVISHKITVSEMTRMLITNLITVAQPCLTLRYPSQPRQNSLYIKLGISADKRKYFIFYYCQMHILYWLGYNELFFQWAHKKHRFLYIINNRPQSELFSFWYNFKETPIHLPERIMWQYCLQNLNLFLKLILHT